MKGKNFLLWVLTFFFATGTIVYFTTSGGVLAGFLYVTMYTVILPNCS